MTDIIAIGLTIALTIAASVPLGRYMARVFSGTSTPLDPLCEPIERLLLNTIGSHHTGPQTWWRYAVSLLISNAAMFAVGFALLRTQGWLPLNPDGMGNMPAALAFNTAASFTTNTNLQHYSGETALSYLSQVLVITFLQFVTAGTGMAACAAIVRALGSSGARTIGNFYVDLTRATTRVLLPLSLPLALALLSQGVPMTTDGAAAAHTVEGGAQTIARGLVAAEVAIKQLGTNGGGYFGPNSAHPFENPTPLSNLLQTISIAIIPMATLWMLGAMLRRTRLAVVLFAAMLALYVPMVVAAVVAESAGSSAVASMGINQPSGSMEGKEVRHGVAMSAFWGATTTATSNGSVNAMLDSFTPIGGLVAMVGLWLNHVFGGVGVGFINLLIVVILTAFIGGMMVGRTPEFLGKKVDTRVVQLSSVVLLWHPFAILVGTAIACASWTMTPDPGVALGWLKNPGPHGFSEILYEFSSSAANNGSGFEGLGDNTVFWNVSTAAVMLLSRYIPIVLPLCLAAALAGKPAAPESAGTLRADSVTFGLTLVAITVILGLLMFAPVAVLGPIAEHLSGR